MQSKYVFPQAYVVILYKVSQIRTIRKILLRDGIRDSMCFTDLDIIIVYLLQISNISSEMSVYSGFKLMFSVSRLHYAIFIIDYMKACLKS